MIWESKERDDHIIFSHIGYLTCFSGLSCVNLPTWMIYERIQVSTKDKYPTSNTIHSSRLIFCLLCIIYQLLAIFKRLIDDDGTLKLSMSYFQWQIILDIVPKSGHALPVWHKLIKKLWNSWEKQRVTGIGLSICMCMFFGIKFCNKISHQKKYWMPNIEVCKTQSKCNLVRNISWCAFQVSYYFCIICTNCHHKTSVIARNRMWYSTLKMLKKVF